MIDPLKRGVFGPRAYKPGSAGHGTFNLAAGGSSPPGFTKHRPVAERFSGGFLIRVNAGSIPAGSTNRATNPGVGAPQ
jgi:hypothetical protein